MRIAMVSEHASPLASLGGVDAGGQNVHVAALATALAGRGHDVTVYTRRDSLVPPARVQLAPGVWVEHIVAGPTSDVPKDELLPYMDEFGDRLASAWDADAPDVVHAHFWMSGLAALRATAGRGIPVTQTFHALGTVKRRWQGAEDTSPLERIAAERTIADQAAMVIATCADEVAELRAMGVATDGVAVVPCGVDSGLFAAHGPAAPRTRRPRLLMMTRLVPRKGIEDAIRALQWIDAAELVIVGGPSPEAIELDPEARRLRRLATSLGLAGRVHLLGRMPHDELPAVVRSADVALVVPWYEPFGIVPLEAMSAGIPVVATSVGGMLDTVVPGVTGLLVPVRSPHGIASAVTALLGSDATRAAMGAAGRHRAVTRYSWDAVARQTEACYIAARSRSGSRASGASR